MGVVSVIAQILNALVLIFVLILLVRLILDWVPMFNREWRPRGAGLIAAEIVYTVTDPPLKALRRVLPPLTIGSVRLDLAFLVLVLGCSILMSILSSI